MAILFTNDSRMPLTLEHGSVLIAHNAETASRLQQMSGIDGVGIAHIHFAAATVLLPYWTMLRRDLTYQGGTHSWVTNLRPGAVNVPERRAVEMLREASAGEIEAIMGTELNRRLAAHEADLMKEEARKLKREAARNTVVIVEPGLPPGMSMVGDPRQRFVRRRK